MDPGLDGDFLLDHLAAGGALRLIADEENIVSRVVEAMAEVVDDASAGAHAAAGDDDGGAGDLQQFLMVLVFLHRIEALEIEGVVASGLEGFGLLVPEGLQVGIDSGDFKPQG